MKKWPVLLMIAGVILALAAAPALAGASKASSAPSTKTYKFRSTGTIVSVNSGANTFVVKIRTMSCASKVARQLRRTNQTIAVSSTGIVLLRRINARGDLSKATKITAADLRPGCRVNVGGKVVVQNGAATLTAQRIAMFAPTYKFQSNATIVSVDSETVVVRVKVKTMSRMWDGWKRMKSLRGQEIPIIVDSATRIFTRQLDADGVAADAVAASFADLVAGNRVHVAGKVIPATDGSNEYHAVRVVEFLPAPVTS